MKRILVTGGCGFLGSHFVEHLLKNTDWQIIVLDRLNYASKGFDRLRDIKAYDVKRIERLTGDFTLPIVDGLAYEIGEVDYIVHLGAETHVNNSIQNPRPFVRCNVLGTMEMLEFARRQPELRWFVYFSTDEVFGPAYDRVYGEWDRYNCTNPYSATKAAGEELCLAYANTYRLPLFIIHCMNAFGERQHPEKFMPFVINTLRQGGIIPIHSNAERTKAGSRFWIHARNIASAVLFLLDKAEQREKYNIVGEKEVDNLEMAQIVADLMELPLRYEMVDFHSARPGHDLRYALDGTRMASMGWRLPLNFEQSLKKTIQWYLNNPRWLEWPVLLTTERRTENGSKHAYT